MERLSNNWFIEGSIDAELKEYILLAYLQHVEENFHLQKLYPQLADLIQHYQNLKTFSGNQTILQQGFKQELKEVDLNRLKLVYEKVVVDDALMQEISLIVSKSMKLMKETIDEGIETYQIIEQEIQLEPVGIEPIYKKEGYLLLQNQIEKATDVYIDKVSSIEMERSTYRSISTELYTRYEYSLTNYPLSIKKDLLIKNPTFPNPSTYLIQTAQPIPILESLLPIVKRKLIIYINQ